MSAGGGGNIFDRIGKRIGSSLGMSDKLAENYKKARDKGQSMTDAATTAKQQEAVEDSFSNQLAQLTEHDVYQMPQLREHYQWVLDTADGQNLWQKTQMWVNKQRGGDDAQMIEQRKAEATQYSAVIDAMTACERRQPALVRRPQRLRIVAALGHEDDAHVRKVLKQHQEARRPPRPSPLLSLLCPAPRLRSSCFLSPLPCADWHDAARTMRHRAPPRRAPRRDAPARHASRRLRCAVLGDARLAQEGASHGPRAPGERGRVPEPRAYQADAPGLAP